MEIKLVEQALGYLKSDKASAASAHVEMQQWETIAKQNAICTLNILKMELEEEGRVVMDAIPEPVPLETLEKEPKRKPGRFMGVAGLAPDYEERTGTY